MYICQKCLVGCIFDSKMEFDLYVNLVLNGCVLTILDVFLPVSGCKINSVEYIYGSNSLNDCIIGRGYIHFDIYTSRCISAVCKNAMYPFNNITVFVLSQIIRLVSRQ